jgi:hypothetical protein
MNEADLKKLLEGEFSSLSITFNDHAGNYCSAAQAIDLGLYDHVDWVSDAEKQKARDNNSVWVIQWYPSTPVGFNAVAASSLDVCLDHAITSIE